MIERLSPWLRGRLARAPMVEKVELWHGRETGKATVETYEITDRSEGASQILAEDIMRRATEHAGSYDRVQQYCVVGLGANDRVLGEHSMRLRGTAEHREMGETEDPSAKGLVSQAMRHAEASTRTMMEIVKGLTQHLVEENQSLRERAAKNDESKMETFTLLEGILSEKHTRDLATETARADDKRKTRMFGHLERLVPQLLAGANPLKQKVKHFAENLTPEEVEKLTEALPPAKAKIVFELLTSVQDEPMEEEEESDELSEKELKELAAVLPKKKAELVVRALLAESKKGEAAE